LPRVVVVVAIGAGAGAGAVGAHLEGEGSLREYIVSRVGYCGDEADKKEEREEVSHVRLHLEGLKTLFKF